MKDETGVPMWRRFSFFQPDYFLESHISFLENYSCGMGDLNVVEYTIQLHFSNESEYFLNLMNDPRCRR